MILFHLLPVGLTGLIMATFLAVAMSTADTALLVVASTLQRDVYAQFRRNISEKERLIVNRVLVVLLGVLGVGVPSDVDPHLGVAAQDQDQPVELGPRLWQGLGLVGGEEEVVEPDYRSRLELGQGQVLVDMLLGLRLRQVHDLTHAGKARGGRVDRVLLTHRQCCLVLAGGRVEVGVGRDLGIRDADEGHRIAVQRATVASAGFECG